MEAISPPRGLIVDLITPMDGMGSLDGRSMGRHLDRMLPYAQGILISGPDSGEGRHLSPEQRGELLEKCLVVIRGRIPIMVWISGETEKQTLATLSLLEKTLQRRRYNGNVFWVDTPLLYHSNRGLPDFYRFLSSSTKRPILLHNDPGVIGALDRPFKRNNIRTSILKEISRMDQIRGMIYVGSLDRAANYQKAVRSQKEFMIYDGDESHFLMHPSLAGVLASGANIAPKAWQRITGSSLNLLGNNNEYPDSRKQIWEMGGFLLKLREIYQKNSIPIIKQILSGMGILDHPECFMTENDVAGELKELKILFEEYKNYL